MSVLKAKIYFQVYVYFSFEIFNWNRPSKISNYAQIFYDLLVLLWYFMLREKNQKLLSN